MIENENKNTTEEVISSEPKVEETVTAVTEAENVTEPATEKPAAEEEAQDMSMEKGMEELTLMRIKPGDVLTGKVIKATAEEVFVNINYMSDGIIPKNEFTTNAADDLTSMVSEGDEIKVVVLKKADSEGNVLLSKRKADLEEAVVKVETALAEGTPVLCKVKEAVKGGLRMDVLGLQGFMPASLVSDTFIPDLSIMNGQELKCNVIEFDKAKKRAVVSRKELAMAEKAEKKAEMLEKLTKGSEVDGKVIKIMNYGAFIDIGGVEGLAHISDLSWGRIKHPSDVIAEGQDVKVLIQEINPTTGKISLSLKTSANDPWKNIEKYQVGQTYPGKVMNIIKSGAFVELEPGLEGYLHISELTQGQVEKVDDVVQRGQEVNVRIKDINTETKKLSLSMREGGQEKERSIRFNRFEKSEGFEQKERPQKREKSERPSRGSNRGARRENIDRGYQDKADNLTIGDLFGDLKSKLNFGDDKE